MNGNGATCRFTNLQEIFHNWITGLAAVGEEEFLMIETGIQESCGIVQFEIQANDCAHIILAKVIEVGLGCMARISIVDFRPIMWAAECDKFIRYDPIQIAILDTLVVLVLDRVEIVEIKEAGIPCFVHRLQAIHQTNCVI